MKVRLGAIGDVGSQAAEGQPEKHNKARTGQVSRQAFLSYKLEFRGENCTFPHNFCMPPSVEFGLHKTIQSPCTLIPANHEIGFSFRPPLSALAVIEFFSFLLHYKAELKMEM